MNWHDLLFSAGSIVFIVSLVPMVLAREKPPWYSALATGIVLTMFVIDYATLGGFLYTSITTGITAILWLIVAAQAARRRGGEHGTETEEPSEGRRRQAS